MQDTTMIVYFTKEGSSRMAAECLRDRMGGTLLELTEQRPGNPLQALFGLGSKLNGTPWTQTRGVQQLVLVTPIWAGHCAPAMSAFLRRMDCTGCRVTLVTVQQSETLQGSVKVLKSMAARVEKSGGQVVARLALRGSAMNVPADEAVRAAIAQRLTVHFGEENHERD